MRFDTLYEASKLLEGTSLTGKVKNLMVIPKWIGGEDRFWLKLQDEQGHQFHIVDASDGKRVPAFDHAAVASALAAAGAGEQQAEALAITDMEVIDEERLLTVNGMRYRCRSDGSACEKLPVEAGTQWRSPSGKQLAFIRDHNLWVRDVATGQERAMTRDGTATHAYGYASLADLTVMARRRSGQQAVPEGIFWSPDGNYLVAFRVNLTEVPERTHLCEYAAPDQKHIVTTTSRAEFPGEHKIGQHSVTIVDVAGQRAYPVQLATERLQDYAWVHGSTGAGLWWQPGKKQLFLETADWMGCRYGIAQVDLPTGRARTVLEESEEHWYVLSVYSDRPNIRFIANGRELIWYSQRSGYGHLYLYDVASGQLKRPLTRGDWVVYDILHVDEPGRKIYFSAGGREPGRNPYYRHLYRVSLDGGEPQLLTPEDADHEFGASYGPPRSTSSIAPSGRYFVDAYSTVVQPPVGVLRRTDGTKVSELYRANADALNEIPGWRPPEPFVVKAADGATDLYGVMYKPPNFDPNKKYPLVEMTYPGPQGKATPTNFMGIFQAMIGNPYMAANLGMIVIALDGRGCAGRSRAFRYAFAGTEDVFGSADHVAAIKNLAARHSFIDVDRVGVSGISYGGYGSLRAQLLNGPFFKACVSASGPADWRWYGGGSIWTDRYFRQSEDPKKADQYFELVSNARLAPRLEGKLLLIYGELDEGVTLNHAFSMFEALQKAGKDYDSLMLTNQGHVGSLIFPYGARRTLKFLFDNLQVESAA